MSRYRIKRVTYEEIDLDREDLMTVSEAAKTLGITIQGVIAAIQRDRMSEVIDNEAAHSQQERRLLLRSDVVFEQHRRAQSMAVRRSAESRPVVLTRF